LLKSVWERQDNDVFLIGPQHFDLSIAEVRDKLTEISGMRDVIAKDLWDVQQSAHAQVIDLQTGKEAATQLGSLLLTASLSTAVNAVKGRVPYHTAARAVRFSGGVRGVGEGRMVSAPQRRPLLLR
jgi:hypothetical protein